MAKNSKVTPNDAEVEDCNIGIEKQPKIIKLSKNLTPKSRERYVNLMREYSDVFSWIYDDLKVYDTSIIQDIIPIKEGERPFKKKLRRLNPLLLPLIEKGINKLFDANIIVYLKHTKWLANLVPVRKIMGKLDCMLISRTLTRYHGRIIIPS